MKRIYIIVLCLIIWNPIYSQGVISDINTENFTEVSFIIHSNNPEIQDSSKIQVIEENGKGSNVNLVPLDYNEQRGVLDVLFLWDLKGRVSFVPELLADFFNKMEQSDSLRAYVVIFKRNIEGEKVYKPLLESFTNNLEKIRDAIYKEAGELSSYSSSSSDIIWALDKALDNINNSSTEEGPKAIVLCSEGKNNMDSGFDISAITAVKGLFSDFAVAEDIMLCACCMELNTAFFGLYSTFRIKPSSTISALVATASA